MSFFDNVKKTMDSIEQKPKVPKSESKLIEKVLAESLKIISEKVSVLLLTDEVIDKIYGLELGYACLTNKRLLIGTTLASTSKPKKLLSFIPLNKITGIEFEYEWGLVLNSYKIVVYVSSKEYEVIFGNETDLFEFHKNLSDKLV